MLRRTGDGTLPRRIAPRALRAAAIVLALAALACTGLFSLSSARAGQAAAALGSQNKQASFVIRNARIFDGSRVIPSGDVWVEDGKIKAVGAHLAVPASVHALDAAGQTLLPGLIDAHTHTFSEEQLRSALAFGVTTELDMFTSYEFARQIRQSQAAGEDLDIADLRSAGTLVTAPHGHGTEYGLKIPTIESPAEAQAFVDARIAEGSDYIKIIYENGSAYGRVIPTISKETLAAVIAAAHKRGKLAVVHIGSLEGARDAIAADADGLMHLFEDAAPPPDFGAFVAAHHAFVVPTLSVLRSATGLDDAALAADPCCAPYLSAADIANLKRSFPALPGKLDFAYSQQAVRQLKSAHVPLLAGTDAPNPGTAHGVSLHGELELLVQAGLTPVEALIAATASPAKAFHLDDRGEIVPGKRADLLLVKGDPTTDILATRNIVAVWKLGVEMDRAGFRAAVQKANEALGKSTAAAPAGSESGLVSDFESGTPATNFGQEWKLSTDSIAGGKSTGEIKIVEGGAHGSKGALLISGNIDPAVPFAWAGAIFSPGAAPFAPVDLSSKKQIRFWARGDGKTYRLMLFTQSTGYNPLVQTFVAGPEWKEYTILFSAFHTEAKDLSAVLFVGGPQPGTFSLQIDDVRIE